MLVMLLPVVAVSTVSAQQNNDVSLEQLYQQLDEVVANGQTYTNNKLKQIEQIKKEFRNSVQPLQRYAKAKQLFNEYSKLINDSTLKYGRECHKIALSIGNKDLIIESTLMLSHQYIISGSYEDAKKYLQDINPAQLTEKQKGMYYNEVGQLYGELSVYSSDPELSNRYWKVSESKRDTLLAIIDSTSTEWLSRKVAMLLGEQKFDEALHYCDEWERKVTPESSDYAFMAYSKSEVYKGKHDRDMRKRWLAISAISDLKCSIMNQASLWMLAKLLSEDGDQERAYRYIEYSWQCASRFNAHMRNWQISPVLTTINENYKSQLKAKNRTLWGMVALVSLLSVVLLTLYIYVGRKRRQLAVAQHELKNVNGELEQLNNQLKDANSELSQKNFLLSETNDKLTSAMSQLNDSNRVKDEYIGKFLSICSEYIDKLNNYRIKVNRKLKAGQHADLLRMTSSEQLKDDELKELFQNFDTVFLHLFPTFIDDFNALLQPSERINIDRDKKQLNTDLRIFALIRLGIDESSKIAEFLRYSPNSIYAYRARIKNKAAGNRDDFERLVKEIGIIEKQ